MKKQQSKHAPTTMHPHVPVPLWLLFLHDSPSYDHNPSILQSAGEQEMRNTRYELTIQATESETKSARDRLLHSENAMIEHDDLLNVISWGSHLFGLSCCTSEWNAAPHKPRSHAFSRREKPTRSAGIVCPSENRRRSKAGRSKHPQRARGAVGNTLVRLPSALLLGWSPKHCLVWRPNYFFNSCIEKIPRAMAGGCRSTAKFFSRHFGPGPRI